MNSMGVLKKAQQLDRAAMYGILPQETLDSYAAEQIADSKALRPKYSDTDKAAQERMLRYVTKGDLQMLYKPQVFRGMQRETDFNHMDEIAPRQRAPTKEELSEPPTFNYADSLNKAISNGQRARSEFQGYATKSNGRNSEVMNRRGRIEHEMGQFATRRPSVRPPPRSGGAPPPPAGGAPPAAPKGEAPAAPKGVEKKEEEEKSPRGWKQRPPRPGLMTKRHGKFKGRRLRRHNRP